MKKVFTVLLIACLFLIAKAQLTQTQIDNMSTDLSSYGTIEACDYNGDSNNSFIVVITGFTNNLENKNAVNTILDSYLTPEGFTEVHLGISGTTLKAEWFKN